MYDENEFRMRYRFSKRVFKVIVDLFSKQERNSNDQGDPIAVEDRFLITLRYYATASFQTILADFNGIDQATVCWIVNNTTKLIAAKFHEFIKTPTRL